MCLSNVYENSVEQKNLILSNVQRIDCKDGFVVLYDLFERETRPAGPACRGWSFQPGLRPCRRATRAFCRCLRRKDRRTCETFGKPLSSVAAGRPLRRRHVIFYPSDSSDKYILYHISGGLQSKKFLFSLKKC